MELIFFIPLDTWFFLRLSIRQLEYIGADAIPFNESRKMWTTKILRYLRLTFKGPAFFPWKFNIF